MNQNTVSNLLSEHRLSDSSLDFLELIKFQDFHIETPDRFEIITYINNSPYFAKKTFESYYEVGFCETFPLKTSRSKSDKYLNFIQINKDRKSTRKFSNIPISFKNLSEFLQLLYRITGEETKNVQGHNIIRKRRNIASGGSMYPTEVFIINNKIEQLPKGAYRYNIYNVELELVHKTENEQDMSEVYKLFMKKDSKSSTIDFENASAFIVFTSILNKHSFKYKDFGLVLSLVEIGEFIHSGYLAASVLDLACCAYGGLINDKMNKYLDLRNPLHLPIIYMALGNKDTVEK